MKELAAVTTMLFLLLVLAVPAGAEHRGNAQALRCMANARQLQAAWQLYADENGGRIVHNLHGADSVSAAGASRFSPWASGWLTWATDSDNTNTLFLQSSRYAKLSPYLPKDSRVFKCPSDVYLSVAQRSKGWKERVRTYSMNMTVGHVNGTGNLGPWNPIYARALQLGDLRHPSPGETFVFVEEHPDSMNDVALFPPYETSWIDVPGNLHQGAGTFSFADGHAEIHAWQSSLRHARVTRSSLQVRSTGAGDPDLHWTSYHSQRVSTRSF